MCVEIMTKPDDIFKGVNKFAEFYERPVLLPQNTYPCVTKTCRSPMEAEKDFTKFADFDVRPVLQPQNT
jgi:hypothetical protein